jgi:membrane-associated phospholipid phosphatase
MLCALGVLGLAFPIGGAHAQHDGVGSCGAAGASAPAASAGPRAGTRRWIGASALLLASIAADVRVRDFAAGHRSTGVDRVANVADPFGRAGVLVPTLAAAVIAPRLFGARSLSDAAARVAVDYVASDAVESVLKPLVGRHRPSDGGGAWRFRSLVNDADWHSFPSAHVVHATSIAVGLAEEARPRWIGDAAFGIAGLVGLERVYTGAHWPSDVVASGMLAVGVSGATDRWVREHGIGGLIAPVPRCRTETSAARMELGLEPPALGLRWRF